jgi:hypothetical protein
LNQTQAKSAHGLEPVGSSQTVFFEDVIVRDEMDGGLEIIRGSADKLLNRLLPNGLPAPCFRRLVPNSVYGNYLEFLRHA